MYFGWELQTVWLADESSHNTQGSSYGSGPDFCNLCPRFQVWNPGFCFSKVKVLFSSFGFASPGHRIARIAGLRFRAPNGITGRAPTTPGEVPTGVGRSDFWASDRTVQGTWWYKHIWKLRKYLRGSIIHGILWFSPPRASVIYVNYVKKCVTNLRYHFCNAILTTVTQFWPPCVRTRKLRNGVKIAYGSSFESTRLSNTNI